MAVISAFITNLGKYNEGELMGKWHDFPTSKEAIRQTLKEIGIDGLLYEEFFVTDYETPVEGIYDCLPEYANIDELNYLAAKLEGRDNWEMEAYEAAVASGEYSGSLQDLINLTDNLNCFDYLAGVTDDNDLGYYWVEESGCYHIKDMGNYIDYERFGRDIRFDEGGAFAANGYIRSNGDTFDEGYDGMNVPDEYRVFALPKPEPPAKAAARHKPAQDRDAR